MAFHPEKCSAIRVTRASKPILSSHPERTHSQHGGLHTVHWSGTPIQHVLESDNHKDKAVQKANSTLGFLCRNLKLSNEQIKSAAYFSMVLKAYHRVPLNSLEPPYQGICQQSGNGATMCSQMSPTCTATPVVTSMLDP